ncbi:hypothetical protein Cgig2_014500 [Carnegiea gigantea]|uniref:Uncharacterized protein n=1 Tax=Carnegiea gigantea TaxID=171969 RepID=A0A9Q1JYI7_9CARY|nr:hypothetical protein Cgig2_011611 [Carnegiea gigantea]KAJ8433459.1 hypothetical protein Cgig2_014500 [Carnegiea gigantea]
MKFRNKNTYCERHEDYRHTTSKCHGLKKAHHRNRHNPKRTKDHDVECNIKIIATIIKGIDDKELNTKLKQLIRPTITFGPRDMHPLQTSHNDALVIQLKIAIAMIHRILMDMGVLLISSLVNALGSYNTMKKGLGSTQGSYCGIQGTSNVPL